MIFYPKLFVQNVYELWKHVLDLDKSVSDLSLCYLHTSETLDILKISKSQER